MGDLSELYDFSRCSASVAAAGFWALRAASEGDVYDDERVTIDDGGPLPVSTPLLERDAGARLAKDALLSKLSSGSCGESCAGAGSEVTLVVFGLLQLVVLILFVAAVADCTRRDCGRFDSTLEAETPALLLCDKSGSVGDLRIVWYCSRSFLSESASANMAILGMGGSALLELGVLD